MKAKFVIFDALVTLNLVWILCYVIAAMFSPTPVYFIDVMIWSTLGCCAKELYVCICKELKIKPIF